MTSPTVDPGLGPVARAFVADYPAAVMAWVASRRPPRPLRFVALTYSQADWIETQVRAETDEEAEARIADLYSRSTGIEPLEQFLIPAESEVPPVRAPDDESERAWRERASGATGECDKLGVHHAGQRVLNEVAWALNRADWRAVVATTDDFLVYATHPYGEDLEENIVAAARPETVHTYTRLGWLG